MLDSELLALSFLPEKFTLCLSFSVDAITISITDTIAIYINNMLEKEKVVYFATLTI